MLKLNLGRFITILLLPLLIFAQDVEVSVNSDVIQKGDEVILTIRADGNSIEFPKIDNIAGYPIVRTSKSEQFLIKNQVTKRVAERKYSFIPDKNVTIPTFKIVVDNQPYETKPIDITVTKSRKYTGNQSQDSYQSNRNTNQKALNSNDIKVTIRSEKSSLYVGEPTVLELEIMVNTTSNIKDFRIKNFNSDNFWLKALGTPTEDIQGNYIIQKYRYLIFPQKSGELKLGPILIKVAKAIKSNQLGNDPLLSMFFQEFVWIDVLSNELTFNVKPLPSGVNLYGDFNIKSSVDRKKVDVNKAVNLTIEIEGIGNVEDIKKINLDIEGATIYSDEPQLKEFLKNGKYGGKFTQKIAIVSDRNYTIPPIELKFFSSKEHKVKTIKTAPIDIEVIGGKSSFYQKQPLVIKNSTEERRDNKKNGEDENKSNSIINLVENTNSPSNYLYTIIAYLLGIITAIGFLKAKNRDRKREDKPLYKKIKSAKNDKELFRILLPYSNIDELKETLNRLEDNIYRGGKYKIDKREIIDILDDLDIN